MEIFFDNVKKLKVLVKNHQDKYPNEDMGFVNELIDHGEEQIGFETFCDALIDFPITQEFYDEMLEICKHIEADIDYIHNLEKFIIK